MGLGRSRSRRITPPPTALGRLTNFRSTSKEREARRQETCRFAITHQVSRMVLHLVVHPPWPQRSILAWSQQIASQTQATVESFSLAVAKQSTKETVMASSSMARSSRARKLENSRLSPSQR